eukprot:1158253-Pelagomonas_calceolata.AAC.2
MQPLYSRGSFSVFHSSCTVFWLGMLRFRIPLISTQISVPEISQTHHAQRGPISPSCPLSPNLESKLSKLLGMATFLLRVTFVMPMMLPDEQHAILKCTRPKCILGIKRTTPNWPILRSLYIFIGSAQQLGSTMLYCAATALHSVRLAVNRFDWRSSFSCNL